MLCLAAIFYGCVNSFDLAWNLADIFMGFMAIINLVAILLLGKWALAALSVGVPLSGWLMSSAADKPIFFYGLFQVPMLVAPDKALGHLFKESHELLGLTTALLVALHVAGAIRYHFIVKDRVLLRMLGW